MDVVTNHEDDLPRPAPRPDTPDEQEAVAIEELGLLGLTPNSVPKDPDHELRHALPLRPDSYFTQGPRDEPA